MPTERSASQVARTPRASQIVRQLPGRLRVLLTAVSLLVFGLVPAAWAQNLALDQCHRVPLSDELEWPTSGVWTTATGLDALLVVDALARRVASISPFGQVGEGLAGEIVLASSGLLRPLTKPSQIRAAGGGYLIEDEESDEILRLNSYLEVAASIPVKTTMQAHLSESEQATFYERHAIYGWAPMGQGFLAFGDLKGPEGWLSAFFYFDGQGQLEILERFDIYAEVTDHYLRNTSYIAVLGDTGYILSLNEPLSIEEVRLGKGINPLPSFPVDFKSLPRLTDQNRQRLRNQGARKATEVYERYEGATMPAGIYASRGGLYLLAKNAMAANGKTAWWLLGLDPENGTEILRVLLPTVAAHLTVIPGDDFWALIEKPRVEGLGGTHAPYMDATSIVFVPTTWLESPGQGGLGAEFRTECALASP